MTTVVCFGHIPWKHLFMNDPSVSYAIRGAVTDNSLLCVSLFMLCFNSNEDDRNNIYTTTHGVDNHERI